MLDDRYPVFLFEYDHDGSRWTVEMPARDVDDARARMNKLPLARYVGILHAKIPAALPGSGLFVRLWCWWKGAPDA